MFKVVLPITTAAWTSSDPAYRQAVRDMALAVSRAQLGVAVFVHTSDGATPVVVRGGMSGSVG